MSDEKQQQEKAKETIKPPHQGPIDEGDVTEPAHLVAESPGPIGKKSE